MSAAHVLPQPPWLTRTAGTNRPVTIAHAFQAETWTFVSGRGWVARIHAPRKVWGEKLDWRGKGIVIGSALYKVYHVETSGFPEREDDVAVAVRDFE